MNKDASYMGGHSVNKMKSLIFSVKSQVGPMVTPWILLSEVLWPIRHQRIYWNNADETAAILSRSKLVNRMADPLAGQVTTVA